MMDAVIMNSATHMRAQMAVAEVTKKARSQFLHQDEGNELASAHLRSCQRP